METWVRRLNQLNLRERTRNTIVRKVAVNHHYQFLTRYLRICKTLLWHRGKEIALLVRKIRVTHSEIKVQTFLIRIDRTPRTQASFRIYQGRCRLSRKFRTSKLWSIVQSSRQTEILTPELQRVQYQLSLDRTRWTLITYQLRHQSITSGNILHQLLQTSINRLHIVNTMKTGNCLLTSITINGHASRTS